MQQVIGHLSAKGTILKPSTRRKKKYIRLLEVRHQESLPRYRAPLRGYQSSRGPMESGGGGGGGVTVLCDI